MRKYLFILLLIIVAAVGLFWGCIESFICNVTAENDPTKEVAVGLNLELTGPYEYYGEAIEDGALSQSISFV